ncbi:hypothetical protein Tco_0531598 [Tanacetum coccineum]
MSDLGCCGLEHHSRALWHYNYIPSWSKLQCHELRKTSIRHEVPRYIGGHSLERVNTDTVCLPASSAVTYTSVYTDSELGRPVAPTISEFLNIPGPEEPQTPPVPQDEDEREPMFIQPHDPYYVPEPMYPEYIPLEDEHVFPAEEQPLPLVVSPTAESPGYVVESDPEEDP